MDSKRSRSRDRGDGASGYELDAGADFPRPDKLLKLATTLKLNFADLVASSSKDQPIIAFRKKGGAKTTDAHILKAIAMGSLLKPLVPYL